jgi:hypothetical protein
MHAMATPAPTLLQMSAVRRLALALVACVALWALIALALA